MMSLIPLPTPSIFHTPSLPCFLVYIDSFFNSDLLVSHSMGFGIIFSESGKCGDLEFLADGETNSQHAGSGEPDTSYMALVPLPVPSKCEIFSVIYLIMRQILRPRSWVATCNGESQTQLSIPFCTSATCFLV
jgi:hypothetical protein